MNRLAILSTHPIQYNAPLFKMLSADSQIDLTVFYSKLPSETVFDKDFGQRISWDIPLLDGYSHASFHASTRKGYRTMIHAIKNFNPTAILVYGWNFAGHWKAMRHFKGQIPVWFRGDSTLLDPIPLWKQAIRKRVLSIVYRSVDLAFYVGEANKRYFEWAGLDQSQLAYAPHAVDNAFFGRDHQERMLLATEKRKELGIPARAFVILYVGKLEEKKQPNLLAEAFKELKDENIHLVFVGSGALEGSLKVQTQAQPNIHFVGFQNQQSMPVWYRLGDLLCLPSAGPGETWGLVINEAMACGTPAIVSNRAGASEELGDSTGINRTFKFSEGVQALLVTLKESTQRLLCNPEPRIEIMARMDAYSYTLFAEAIKRELEDS